MAHLSCQLTHQRFHIDRRTYSIYVVLSFLVVDFFYHFVCGEEEEEDFSLLPCVYSIGVCVCACKSSSSPPLSLNMVSELGVAKEL